MAGLFGAAGFARVVFIDPPTMGGAESTTMPVVANGGLQLDDATFGIRLRNRGGGVSSGSSNI